MDVMEHRVYNLEKRFEKRDPSSSVHIKETIAKLRLQLNERDQDLLLNDIILSGIPESKDESPLHLIHLVSSKLGVNVDERDIVMSEGRIYAKKEDGVFPQRIRSDLDIARIFGNG
ncbi:hypothetical protein ACJJTC_007267 [Scirpophaga incertulas]